jgi:hypothetical protein
MAGLIETQTLRASAAQATAGTVTGTAVDLQRPGKELSVQLIVSAAGTDAADTLDVYVDTSFDGGTTYVNLGHFTQVLGNGGAKTFIMSFCNANPGTSAVVNVTSDAAAGATRQIGWGSKLRYRGVFVDADANGSFTYSLTAFVK